MGRETQARGRKRPVYTEKKKMLRDSDSEMPALDAVGRRSEDSFSLSRFPGIPLISISFKEEVENRSHRRKRRGFRGPAEEQGQAG